MPASTTTGTEETRSTMRLIPTQSTMPCPLPMGEPSGMTVAAPASSRRSAETRSGLV